MEIESEKKEFKTIRIQNNKKFRELTRNVPKNLDGRTLWNNEGNIETYTYEETCKPSLIADYYNGFFSAFLNAYNREGDVKVTPDDVWLVIMIYFSGYVKKNAEELRSAFVSHEGQKKLTVTTENELSEQQWDQFFNLMIEEIKKNTNQEATANLQCNFSTTKRVQKILSTASIMNIYKGYFSYERCIPQCGIQQVHLGGSLEDWQKLKDKTLALIKYDVNGVLKNYLHHLEPILENFIQTYQNNVDIGYWNKILNIRGTAGSGFSYNFNGWLLHFFGIYGETQEVQLDSISVDIVIDNKITGIIKTVEMVGGLRAVSMEGQIFRPHMSLAIIGKMEKKEGSEQDIPPQIISMGRYD